MTSKAGSHLGAGIEHMFVLLGMRILDGKPGGSGRALSPSSMVPKGIQLLLSSISTQPTQASNHENVLNRQTYEGIPVSHPRNLTRVTTQCLQLLRYSFARRVPTL